MFHPKLSTDENFGITDEASRFSYFSCLRARSSKSDEVLKKKMEGRGC